MNVDQERLGARSVPAHVSPVTPETHMKDVNVILLFGCTGTGKTSFANIASGSTMEVGKGVRSSTKHLEASRVFQVDDQSVMVVDCPGFNDTYLTETEILRRLAGFLIKAYESEYKLAGLLYFHKISDTRVGGTSFRHMNMFKALCGNEALRNVVYVTNMWSDPPTEDEMLREVELHDAGEFFGVPLANGAQMARHNNTQDSAHHILRRLLGRGQVITNLQRQLVEDKMPLEKTDIGLVIGQDLEDDLLKQQQEMEELMAEREKASKANDQNWLQRLEAQEERTRAKEERLVSQLQALKAKKGKQPEVQSEQPRVARDKVIDSALSAFRAQLETTTNELAQNAKLRDSQLDAYSPTQKEWEKRRNEEIASQVAWINGITADSRRQAASRRAFSEFARDIVSIASNAVVNFGMGACYLLLPGINRNAPLGLTDDNHRPGTHSHVAHERMVENVGNSVGPTISIGGEVIEGSRYRREHTHIPSAGWDTRNERAGGIATPRKQIQAHETHGAPGQHYLPRGDRRTT